MWNGTYLVKARSRETSEPRGLDLLSQMPLQKYKDKLCYVWEWCRKLAATEPSSLRNPLWAAAQPPSPRELNMGAIGSQHR